MPQKRASPTTTGRKRTYPTPDHDPTHDLIPIQASDSFRSLEDEGSSSSDSASLCDDAIGEGMFSLEDHKCPCMLCVKGPPALLLRDSVAWTSIIRVAFFVLHTMYPELQYLIMKTHVSPYILRHWSLLGIDKKGDNVKWKKHILDAIWHGDSFFESGTPVLKQTGVWRLINMKLDPWTEPPNATPQFRRYKYPHQNKKPRHDGPIIVCEDPQPQDMMDQQQSSPPTSSLFAVFPPSIPSQILPHISSLFRHVDDYWLSRSGGTSPSAQVPAQPAAPLIQPAPAQVPARSAQPSTQRTAQTASQRTAQPASQRSAQPPAQRPAQPLAQSPAQPLAQPPSQPSPSTITYSPNTYSTHYDSAMYAEPSPPTYATSPYSPSTYSSASPTTYSSASSSYHSSLSHVPSPRSVPRSPNPHSVPSYPSSYAPRSPPSYHPSHSAHLSNTQVIPPHSSHSSYPTHSHASHSQASYPSYSHASHSSHPSHSHRPPSPHSSHAAAYSNTYPTYPTYSSYSTHPSYSSPYSPPSALDVYQDADNIAGIPYVSHSPQHSRHPSHFSQPAYATPLYPSSMC